MTDERMALIEKGADADLVRELLAFASERLMAAEVDQLAGAAAGVRCPERVNHRNGCRERGWETRAGRIELVIADDHKGLRAAARRVFNAGLQRCRVHWARNLLAHAASKQRAAVPP